jgi:pimeloyl-ACP methyl ester carboxylesterase
VTGPHIIATNTVELCTETFGDPDHTTVLLVTGAGSSMLSWDDRFCRQLAAGRCHVIRYDHRDVGRSTMYEPGQATYTLEHLADDAVAVLDHFAAERAHLVGASMGGMIVQLVALRHPARVHTITAITSTPDPVVTCSASGGNHAMAIATTPPWRHRLGEIDCPALVIHGAADPLLPLAHGVDLAAAIPGARLLTLDVIGWDAVLTALAAMVRSGRAA